MGLPAEMLLEHSKRIVPQRHTQKKTSYVLQLDAQNAHGYTLKIGPARVHYEV